MIDAACPKTLLIGITRICRCSKTRLTRAFARTLLVSKERKLRLKPRQAGPSSLRSPMTTRGKWAEGSIRPFPTLPSEEATVLGR